MRAITDFSNEFDQALMNAKMAPEIESVFLMTALEHLFISGTRIREVAALGYNIDDLVPRAVSMALKAKFNTAH
jgi:pantetheine-phosphate adenylyltransferase